MCYKQGVIAEKVLTVRKRYENLLFGYILCLESSMVTPDTVGLSEVGDIGVGVIWMATNVSFPDNWSKETELSM